VTVWQCCTGACGVLQCVTMCVAMYVERACVAVSCSVHVPMLQRGLRRVAVQCVAERVAVCVEGACVAMSCSVCVAILQ